MPTRLPTAPDLSQPEAQAAYVADAFLARDPFLIVLALKEVGAVRRVPVVLDENPPLSEVLRALAVLGFDVAIARAPEPGGTGSKP